MDVVAEILAEMALDPPKEPTCHFMRLPLELRKRIYALLLLSPPVTRVHCSIHPLVKQCSPGGRFLASTCKPRATAIRTVGCGTCEWRGGHVDTAILATNHAIYEEATDVLYENSQVVCFPDQSLHLSYGGRAKDKIRRYAFVMMVDLEGAYRLGWHSFSLVYPNLKVIELHFDVDLTKPEPHCISVQGFDHLTQLDEVEVVVDVHIVCAWNEIEDVDWYEPISRRDDVSDARALALDEQAMRMRLKFIQDLGEIFKVNGKSLVIREN